MRNGFRSALVLLVLFACAGPCFGQKRDALLCLYYGCEPFPAYGYKGGYGIAVPAITEGGVLRNGAIRAIGFENAPLDPRPEGRRKIIAQWDIYRSAAVSHDPAPIDIRKFRISGNTLFDTQKLEAPAAPFLGERRQVRDALLAARAIQTYYRERGFVFVLAYVPEQVVQDGVVEIEVLEGKIADVKVRSSADKPTDALARQMEEYLVRGEIIEERDFDVCLLLAYGTGTWVTFSVEPAKRIGFADIMLEIKKLEAN